MKKIISAGRLLIIVLVFALAALPGCSKKEQNENKETVSGQDVKTETTEAMEKAADQTEQQMDAFYDQMDNKLVEYGKEIDLLQSKTEILEGDARTKADQELEALRQKYSDAYDKVNELKNSGTDEWEQLKMEIGTAMDDLGNAYKNTEGDLEKPIESVKKALPDMPNN
jgi:septal ring factor EnvC (AmiA/AmiB activator)